MMACVGYGEDIELTTYIVVAFLVAILILAAILKRMSPEAGRRRKGRRPKSAPRPETGGPFSALADVAIIDFETTGLDCDQNRIVSAAVIAANIQDLIENRSQNVQHWTAQFNPERRIPAAASKVHGITNADVKDKRPFREHAESLLAFIGSRTIIAHNADFDAGFLRAELERCGLAFPDVPVLCTMKHGAAMFGRSRISLDTLARELGIGGRASARHDALGDAMLALKVTAALAAAQRGLRAHSIEIG